MQKISIFWFRRDLRLYDNTGLYYALNDSDAVLPIFIFDTEILDKLEHQSDARVQFIHDRISKIKETINQTGSDLRVYLGKPLDVYKKLISEFEVQSVYTNRDYEPYAINRDKEIENLLSSHGIGFYSFKDHVIFEKEEIISDSGNVYKVYTPYSRKWKAKLDEIGGVQILEDVSSHPNWLNIDAREMPKLESIGFQPSEIQVPPIQFNTDLIKNYEAKRNFPSLNNTSRLGIHLRFGTISIREAVAQALKLSETWLNELVWREFYIQILYNFPHVVKNAFKPQYDTIPWSNDEEHFRQWCNGTTGYPLVDAGMRELNTTGFMHNRVRMVVASFLTKHLLIDWRWGEAYFASKLLDFELASNNGGWQWAAGTGTDAQPYFRVFNPQSQLEKFDKDLSYVKKWVPEYGTDLYPNPIVEHKYARQRAIDTYKTALT